MDGSSLTPLTVTRLVFWIALTIFSATQTHS